MLVSLTKEPKWYTQEHSRNYSSPGIVHQQQRVTQVKNHLTLYAPVWQIRHVLQNFDFKIRRDHQIFLLWASRLWVGRRKEPILVYVPKNYGKKNSGSKGLMNVYCAALGLLFDISSHARTTYKSYVCAAYVTDKGRTWVLQGLCIYMHHKNS